MDNRRLVFAMLLAMGLILLWQPAFIWIGTRLGYDMTPRRVAETTQPTAQESNGASSLPTSENNSGTAPSSMAAAPGGLRVAPTTQSTGAVVIGSTTEMNPNFKLALNISPQGAGLDSVVLNEFKRAVTSKDPFIFEQPYPGAETATRALATRSVSINGVAVDLSAVDWSPEGSDQQSARFSVTINNDAGPMARVHKSYQLLPPTDASQGYEVIVTHSFENLTDQPLKVRATFNGPTMPPKESDRGADRQVIAGHVQQKNVVVVAHDLVESFTREKGTKEYARDKDGNPVMWAGAASIYFQAIARPMPLAKPDLAPDYIDRVTAVVLNPDATAVDHEVALTVATTELTVAPKQSLSLPMRVFFGPRLRKLLNSTYYSTFPVLYDQTLVLTSGPCGFCTFQWLINILVVLLGWFHVVFRDWGLAIIGLVILVRAILHPVTKKSQISMSKMSKMGPEMERLKKKYGDDKDELNKAMMGFYKEQGVTPILGCLPMFLQMPIWIALWQSLQTTFELRQAPFLQFFGVNLTWIHDLSKPDHLIELAQPFNLFFIHVSGLNILPFLLAIVFYLQTKMQPKPAAMTPEQEQQQKMMSWMTLLFPLMLYSGPSGLNLYILTSTGIGIVESKIVRDHIKQREEAEKAGRVIVDAGKKFKRSGGPDPLGHGAPPAQPKPGGIRGWLANLQQRAEDIRRDKDKRK